MRLFTWENYLQANVNKEDAKAIWKVCFKFYNFFSSKFGFSFFFSEAVQKLTDLAQKLAFLTCYGLLCSNFKLISQDSSVNLLGFMF